MFIQIAVANETVERRFRPAGPAGNGWRQFEHTATISRFAAFLGRGIDVSGGIERQVAIRYAAILREQPAAFRAALVGDVGKDMQHGWCAARCQLEHGAT